MTVTRPLISICIPVYNMYPYVIQTIQSAVAQTYENIEVIVLENASKDESAHFINQRFANDTRVSIHTNDKTVPIYENWNMCVQKSNGSFFMVLNADDILSPVFIENCYRVFENKAGRNMGYVFSEWDLIDATNKLTHRPAFYSSSGIIPMNEELRINIIGSHTHPSSMLIRRSLYDEVGGYENDLGLAADMHFKLKLNLKYDVGYLDHKLWYYRRHPGQETSARNLQVLYSIYKVKKDILSKMNDELFNVNEAWEQFMKRYETDIEVDLQVEQKRDLKSYSFWKSKYEKELGSTFNITMPDTITYKGDRKKKYSSYPLPKGSIVL
jgi:glycosyltransferase involved in cell wall biosynthesis